MHPKILIVGTVPYNRNMTSRAFDSYFHNWEKENLAQIFSNPQKPLKGHCGTFYQITDKRMLERHFNKKITTGKIFNYSDLSENENHLENEQQNFAISLLYKIGSKKFPLNHLLRKLLWKKKYWCTEKLINWINDFKPECIFLAFSDDFFILKIALYISEKYKIPIIPCIGDDYYFNGKLSISPLYYIYKASYKSLVKRVLKKSQSAVYISDKIMKKYNNEFNLNGKTIYLSSELKRHDFKKINIKDPYISYCGNIRLGRNDSLNKIANALKEINPSYKIHVYSNEKSKIYIKKLLNNSNIEYHGAVPYREVKKIMSKSDINIIVEGFSKENVRITKYSLSTKVADSLASGSNILSFGSQECGAIEYMKEIKCGAVCSNEKNLVSCIKKLLYNEQYQLNNYNNAIKITNMHHNLQKSNNIFEKIVESTLNSNERSEENDK